MLLQHGADANAFGSERSTPLHFMALAAPERQPLRIATMLVQYGASATIPNRFGKTAHDLAKVGISGLAGRPELNGLRGTITGYAKDKGRLAVAVIRSADVPPEHVLLKPANLALVSKINAEGEEVPVDDDDAPPPLE